MRARSAWLSHPKFKATWVAIAAGSLAGLAVLGACSQDSAKIVGTRPVPESPRLGTIVGGNAHVVKVCSDLNSTGGPITVNVSFQGGMLETSAIDTDRQNAYQYNFGPYAVPDVITSTVTISPNECKTVFQRNNTCPALADCSDPLQHLGNRLWTNESNTNTPPTGGSGPIPQGSVSVPWPNIPQVFNGIVNPRAGVFITAVIPNGYTLNNLSCTNDDPSLPQSCVNGGYSSANVFHGSTFTYLINGETVCPPGSLTAGFNGTAIPTPRTIWFTANLKPSGPIVDGTVISFTGTNIHLSNGGLPPGGVDVPSTNGQVTYSAAAAIATTSYNVGTNTWETIVPLSKTENAFLAGTQFAVPVGGLTGGTDATWTGAFASTTPGVTAKWQFAAAVYDPFSLDYNALGVKPLSSNTLTIYPNSDKLGTPENFKLNLKSGAMGGGGSNFIGSWSATKAVCVE